MQETSIGSAKSSLNPPRARLVEWMQRINFGRIEGLAVRGGEPVIIPPPRIVREVKFGADNGPHPKTSTGDFLLKSQVREFFARLKAMGDGTIVSLEIKHGLPFRMIVEEDTAA
jgi:hypothetical protein